MRKVKVLAQQLAAVSALSLCAASANAFYISSWNFVTDGGFVTASSDCESGGPGACSIVHGSGITSSSNSGDVAGTATRVSWGTEFNNDDLQSGLEIVLGAAGNAAATADSLSSDAGVVIPAFGPLVTDGGWSNISAALHYNNVIRADGGNLAAYEVLTTLNLAPLTPIAFPFDPTEAQGETLSGTLNETANNGNCVAGAPNGSNCDDVFTVGPLGFGGFGINLAGNQYFVEARRVAGPGAVIETALDGTDTIWTAEGQTSAIFTQARIRQVPAPAPLVLIGLGMAFLARKLRVQKA